MNDRVTIARLRVNLLVESSSSVTGWLEVRRKIDDTIKTPFYIEVSFSGGYCRYEIRNREGSFTLIAGDIYQVDIPTNPNTDRYQVIDASSNLGRFQLFTFQHAFRSKVLSYRLFVPVHIRTLHYAVYRKRYPEKDGPEAKYWPYLKGKKGKLPMHPMVQAMLLIGEEWFRTFGRSHKMALRDCIKKWWQDNKLDPLPQPLPRHKDFLDCIKPSENLFDYRTVMF